MKFVRVSQLTGILREKDLPVTERQLARFEGGDHIQDAFPHLSANDREFILTGIVSSEWDNMFGEDDDTSLSIID